MGFTLSIKTSRVVCVANGATKGCDRTLYREGGGDEEKNYKYLDMI